MAHGEWVLKIRNGQLMSTGVGILAVRWPWERIVRFTAAMQRAAFTTDARSAESLPVAVQALVLWSVRPDGGHQEMVIIPLPARTPSPASSLLPALKDLPPPPL